MATWLGLALDMYIEHKSYMEVDKGRNFITPETNNFRFYLLSKRK